MSTATPATRALDKAGIAYEVLEYDYVAGQDKIGIHAAAAIGADPASVLKTLMVEVDGKPMCTAIPSDRSLSMKKVAQVFKGKSAQMMDPAKAERLTGFRTGGISPFGQKRAVPTAFHAPAMTGQIVLNGGTRGMMVRLAASDALTTAAAKSMDLCAD